MKTTENVSVYQCDFCKKKLFVKWAMKKHEAQCDNNPLNIKPCMSCEHLNQVDKDVWFDNPYYNPDYNDNEGKTQSVKVFKCEIKDILMFPFKIEKHKRHIIHPSTYDGQEPMPNNCLDYQEKKYF